MSSNGSSDFPEVAAALEEAKVHVTALRALFERAMGGHGMTVATYRGLRGYSDVVCAEGHEARVTPIEVLSGCPGDAYDLMWFRCKVCASRPHVAAAEAKLFDAAKKQRVKLTPTGTADDSGYRDFDAVCREGHAFVFKDGRGTLHGERSREAPRGTYIGRDKFLCPYCQRDHEYAEGFKLIDKAIAASGATVVKRYPNAVVVQCRVHRGFHAYGSFMEQTQTMYAEADARDSITANFCQSCNQQQELKRVTDDGAAKGVTVIGRVLGPGHAKYRGICYVGHDFETTAGRMKRGCPTCPKGTYRSAMKPHRMYYVVSGLDAQTGRMTVKPGITHSPSSSRLQAHADAGLTSVHLTVADLPFGYARTLEVHVLDYLKANGWHPLRGREYFPDQARTEVLGEASSWLANELWMLPAKHGHSRPAGMPALDLSGDGFDCAATRTL